MSDRCAVANCENTPSSRSELCSSCERGLSSLRKALGEAEARRLLGLSPSEDSGELSLVDDSTISGDVIIDSAISGDVIIDLSGEAPLSTADVDEPSPRLAEARERVAMAIEHKRGTANPEVILWLAQRHADAPSKATLELLRQAVGG